MKAILDNFRHNPFYHENGGIDKFDGESMANGLHHIRGALNKLWIDCRNGKSKDLCIGQLNCDISFLYKCKSWDEIFNDITIRDDFEIFYLYALLLIGNRDRTATESGKVSFQYCENGYGYYSEFKKLMIKVGADAVVDDAVIARIKEWSAIKLYHFPNQGFLKELSRRGGGINREIVKINKSFDVMARKCKAINSNGDLLIKAMNQRYLYALPESALIAGCGLISDDIIESKWLFI
jgi:hypothetical protein